MARRAQAHNQGKKGGRGSRKTGFSASRLFDIASAGKESLDSMGAAVLIRVHVGPGCERALVLAAKEALVAERAAGEVEVLGIEPPSGSAADPDAVVILGGPSEAGAGALVRFYAACGVPCAYACETALDAPAVQLGEAEEGLFGVVCASSADALAPKLASWLAKSVPNPIALAANFPFCRDAVVRRLASSCAMENAAVGAISLIPGSDFPIMCASQAKLALDIAAAYGNGAGLSRAAELAGVVGAGIAYRGVARAAAGLLPGLGWAVKAGIGYAGTMATARAVQARFELPGAAAKKGAGSGEQAAPGAARLQAPGAPSGRRAASGASRPADGDGYLTIPETGGEGVREG